MQTLWLSESSLAHRCRERWRRLFPDDRANEHALELLKSMPARFDLRIHALPRTAASGNDSTRSLASVMGEVEYPAVSVAIARFQNRLKTERSS